ncbi:SLATT domain-containing protein [Roseibium album]|nr:SLATT domain-containing protein [Roseibium album]
MDAEEAKRLRRKMHYTKGARFEAHKRLLVKYRLSLWSISILSFYVICISIGLLVFLGQYDPNIGKYLTFLSVAMSVFIIILSLLNESNSYQSHSKSMHDCARDITRLYNSIPLSNKIDEEYYKEKLREYQIIIDKYDENHESLDLLCHRFRDPFNGDESVRFPYMQYFLNVYAWPIIYILAPLIVVFIFFFARI